MSGLDNKKAGVNRLGYNGGQVQIVSQGTLIIIRNLGAYCFSDG